MSNKILAFLFFVLLLPIGYIEYKKQNTVSESVNPISPVAPQIEAPKTQPQPQPQQPKQQPQQQPRRGGRC
jgi:preprotein translocase subunit SecG